MIWPDHRYFAIIDGRTKVGGFGRFLPNTEKSARLHKFRLIANICVLESGFGLAIDCRHLYFKDGVKNTISIYKNVRCFFI